WNIGNETIFWTRREDERIAFCKFLESIVQDVHAIDPDHPVLYTASAANDIVYLKKYVPSLDIIGINAYGGFDQLHFQLTDLFAVPYLVTEFGSLGEWSRNKDPQGVPFELNDESKMGYYKQYAHKIKSFYGYCLGGFAFYLGDTTQVSLSWWNINYGARKKYSFLAMEDFYKDKDYRRPPFVVKDVRLEKHTLSPAQEFEVSVALKNVLNPEQPVEYSVIVSTTSDAVLVEYPIQAVGRPVTSESPVLKIKAPEKPGIYRVYAVVSQGDYASVLNKSIVVKTPPPHRE
ncbi:MAG: hypothetical protein JNN05_08335, partial [Candidatus Omnitrophica bacterium]|nr:hypothetical protein [Candidatus Omnitrophota bacterium]